MDGSGVWYNDENEVFDYGGWRNFSFICWELSGAYRIIYSGTASGLTLPTSVAANSSISIDFGETEVLISSVKMGEVVTYDYTFTNNVLEISSVTGNLEITVVAEETMTFVIPETGSATTAITSGSLANFITMQFDGYNSSSQYIDSIVVELVYDMLNGNTKQTIELGLDYYDESGTLQQATPQTIAFSAIGSNISRSATFNVNIPRNNSFNLHTHTSSVNNGKPVVKTLTVTAHFADTP